MCTGALVQYEQTVRLVLGPATSIHLAVLMRAQRLPHNEAARAVRQCKECADVLVVAVCGFSQQIWVFLFWQPRLRLKPPQLRLPKALELLTVAAQIDVKSKS